MIQKSCMVRLRFDFNPQLLQALIWHLPWEEENILIFDTNRVRKWKWENVLKAYFSKIIDTL